MRGRPAVVVESSAGDPRLAAVVFVVLAGAAAASSLLVPEATLGALVVAGVLGALGLWGPWLAPPRRVIVDRTGLRWCRGWRGERRLGWDRIARIEPTRRAGIDPMLAIRVREGRDLRWPIKVLGYELLYALRAHAPPGVFRVSMERGFELVDARRAARPATRRASMPDGMIDLRRALPSERRARLRLAATIALVALCGAAAGISGSCGALRLALLGALLAALFVWLAATDVWGLSVARRRWRGFLGDRASVDPRGMVVSLDGRARLRQLHADLHDPWSGIHAHLERLGPGGETTETIQVLGSDLGLPALALPILGRAIAPVSGLGRRSALAEVREGLPGERIDRELLGQIAWLVIERTDRGCLLYRFTRELGPLGDTFHEGEEAARAQAALEHEHGPWRELDPRADPWEITCA